MAESIFIGETATDIEWTISTLGVLDGDGYNKEPDSLEAVKDLIRFLKRDKTENCPNRRSILSTDVIHTDLIPIVKFHDSDSVLFDAVLRLLINLTQPVTSCFAGSSAEKQFLDKTTTTLATEILRSLQKSKMHFADNKFMGVLTGRLKDFLQLEWENRQEEERLITERILLLIENILSIPPSQEDLERNDTDVTAQDQLICAINDSGLVDLLLFIASSQAENQFHLIVLRIIGHMLEEHALSVISRLAAYKEIAKKIKATIFYVTEYRDLALQIFKKYNSTYLSKMFLTDLIESTGVYLRLLEKYTVEVGAGFLVQKRRKKSRKRKRKTEKTADAKIRKTPTGPTLDELEEKWEDITTALCSVLQGHGELHTDAVPFDPLMEVDEDTHKKVAMGRIQRALREGRASHGVALYRASRDLWPADDIFGAADAEPEIEFMELKEIMMAELEQVENVAPAPTEENAENVVEEQEGGGEDFWSEEELGIIHRLRDTFSQVHPHDDLLGDEEEPEYVRTETQFEFNDFLKRFAKYEVLRCYIELLANFEDNSLATNRYIVKFLDKIAFDLDLAPFLYQASLFRILQKIGKNRTIYQQTPHTQELVGFGRRLLRKFLETVKGREKVFAEILFWKNHKIVTEIEHGYGTYE